METTPQILPKPETPKHITITTYNVVSARGTKLLEALRAMRDLNTDIAILTEAKLTGGRHARMGHGYNVFSTDATSPSKGGIALVWRAGPQPWTLEGMRAISANTISATLVTGSQRWLLLGTYLTPNEPPDEELDRIETEFRRHPRLPVIIMGDLNTDIDDTTDERSIAIATTLHHLGTHDVSPLFHQKHRRQHTRHRHMPDGSHQRSRCDYAMVDPEIPVKSLRIVIPPRYVSDHWAVKIQIYSSTMHEHGRYLHNRSRLPAIKPEPDERVPNLLFTQLLDHHRPTTPPLYPPRDAWIADDTWALIDQRNAALRRAAPAEELRRVRKAIRKKIRRDRAERLRATGTEIETHLDAEDPREAWRLVKVWYCKHAKAQPPTPADLATMGKEFQELYTPRPSPGEPIRGLTTFNIPDMVPDHDEIMAAAETLRNGRAPGASGMRTEDIRRWAIEYDDNPEPWNIVVHLVRHAFRTGVVPTRARASTLVLIPKPEPGQMRGIGLLEPLWKLISAIVNRRLLQNITFHDDLHGFLPARGTGTACLEAKLEAQLAFRTGHPLHQVYLDFAKAYDSLDRDRTLIILQDYGVGPNMLRLLRQFWDRYTVTPRQQAFFGDPFHAGRGLATGDIPAPIIFNIVTDAVLRRWYLDITTLGLSTRARFYADDGQLRDHDATNLQTSLTAMETLFLRVGLQINGAKTKSLTVLPTIATTTISTVAYKRRMENTGDSYRERKSRRTICSVCEVGMQTRSLPGHYRSQHPNIPLPQESAQPLPTTGVPRSFVISAPDKHAAIQCPIPACAVTMQGGWYAIRRHFLFRHKFETIIVAEEGQLPHCPECGFQCPVPQTRHLDSDLCMEGRRRDTRCTLTAAIITARSQAVPLMAGNTTLAQVPHFKYLGHWMSGDDSDTMAVSQNILKARVRWGQLSRLLTRQGASRQIMGLFYKATVQAVLLYGAETWTLTQPLLRLLRSFHHRCARYLSRMVNTQNEDGTWTPPPSETARAAAGLHSIETYIQRRTATFLPYIQSRAILRECQTSDATQAAANHPVWWANLAMLPHPASQLNQEAPGDHEPQPAAPPPDAPRRSPRRPTEYIIV